MSAASKLPPETTTAVLNETDRCDRCGARAYTRAYFLGKHDLLFCHHHGEMYMARLVEVADDVACDEVPG